MAINNTLKDIREERNLIQADLAEAIGSCSQTIFCNEGYASSIDCLASTLSSSISSPATRSHSPFLKAQISAFEFACNCFDTSLTLPVCM